MLLFVCGLEIRQNHVTYPISPCKEHLKTPTVRYWLNNTHRDTAATRYQTTRTATPHNLTRFHRPATPNRFKTARMARMKCRRDGTSILRFSQGLLCGSLYTWSRTWNILGNCMEMTVRTCCLGFSMLTSRRWVSILIQTPSIIWHGRTVRTFHLVSVYHRCFPAFI